MKDFVCKKIEPDTPRSAEQGAWCEGSGVTKGRDNGEEAKREGERTFVHQGVAVGLRRA